jgi:hypothetical protein
MNNKKRIELCNMALEGCGELINKKEFTEIHDYINKHAEWEVGMVMLIDILHSDKISINKEQFKKILVAMESMDLGEGEWADVLKNQVKIT